MRWRSAVRRAAPAAALGVVCAFAVGLPVGDLGGQVQRDLGDPVLNVWALSWESSALVNDPGAVYDGNSFWPESSSVAYSESMLPIVPVFAVLRVVAGGGLAANALLVWLLVLGAIGGAYLLARRYVRAPSAALVGAVSYGLGSYTTSHLAQVQLLTLGTFPVVFLLWFRALERRSWRWAVGCGAAVAVASLSSLYYGVILAPCLAAVAVVHLAGSGRWRDRTTLGVAAGAAVAAVVLTLPGLLVYLEIDERTGLERPIEPSLELEFDDILTPPGETLLYDGLADRAFRRPAANEHTIFPGFVTLALGAAGAAALAGSRRFRASLDEHRPGAVVEVGALIGAGAVAAVLALGSEARGISLPFALLHDHAPGFDGIRATARLVVPALLALAVVAAVALDAALARMASERSRAVVGGILAAVLMLELWSPVPWRDIDRSDTVLAVYRELDERPDGAVVELPMGDPRVPLGAGGPTWDLAEPSRMLRSLIDGKPRVNGYSGNLPPRYLEFIDRFSTFPAPDSLALLEELEATYVVLHTGPAADGQPQYTDEAVEQILAELPAGWSAARFGEAWLLARE